MQLSKSINWQKQTKFKQADGERVKRDMFNNQVQYQIQNVSVKLYFIHQSGSAKGRTALYPAPSLK